MDSWAKAKNLLILRVRCVVISCKHVYGWKYIEEYHILKVKKDKMKIIVGLQTYLI